MRPIAGDADLITSIMRWLVRESALDTDQLRGLETRMRREFGSRKFHSRRYYAIGDQFLNLMERNALIRDAWVANVPTPGIARRFHLTQRRVRQICAGLPRQLPLKDGSQEGKRFP